MNTIGGLTRRSWAVLLAAAPVVAQIASVPPTNTPSAVPGQTATKAVDEVRKVSDRLAQTELPMSVEPAFSFHAL